MKAIMGKIHRDSPTVKPAENSPETEIKIRVPLETGINKLYYPTLIIQVNVNFRIGFLEVTNEGPMPFLLQIIHRSQWAFF